MIHEFQKKQIAAGHWHYGVEAKMVDQLVLVADVNVGRYKAKAEFMLSCVFRVNMRNV